MVMLRCGIAKLLILLGFLVFFQLPEKRHCDSVKNWGKVTARTNEPINKGIHDMIRNALSDIAALLCIVAITLAPLAL